MSRRRRTLLAALYAVASFFAFPQAMGQGSIDLGVVLAPAVPLLLLLVLRQLPPRRAAGVAFATGLAGHAAVLHWIYVVTVVYGNGAPPVGVAAVLLLAAFVAAFTALFGAGFGWLAARDLDSPLPVAMWWTAVDHLRSFAFTGFPWATLGYAWHGNAAVRAFAPFTGVYGLSFAAVLTAAAAFEMRRGRPRRAALAAAAVAAIHGVGLGLAAGDAAPAAPSLRVAVLQGNIEQGVKWDPTWAERTWEIYASLTAAAAARGAEVVVWPETAVPGSPDASLDLRERLAELARRHRLTLVVGAVGIDGFDAVARRPRGTVRYYDSAYVISPAGEFLDRYDKTQLVPFGEYVPLRALLGRFVKALATGVTSGDVSPGPEPRAVALPDTLDVEDGRRVSVGVPICYELIFPDLVRRFVRAREGPGGERRDGARVLFGVTNDAWYGRTGAPYQFLVMTALRSAETRTWTARAANTGVSAFIDERGRVQERTRIFERDFLVRDVPLRPPDERGTFYVRHGDRFAQACWLGIAVVAAHGARRSRKRRPAANPPGVPHAPEEPIPS